MSMSRVIDHVYEQVWEDFCKPTHPEDVQNLRDTITTIVSAALAYLDAHQEPAARWTDE